MATAPKPQQMEHVRLPDHDVYCGRQSHPFRDGAPLLLPAEHAQDLRSRGLKVETEQPAPTGQGEPPRAT